MATARDPVAGEPPPYLGVERSLTGKRWRQRLADEREALAIAQRLGVPEIVGRLLAGRGVAPEEAERYLDPTLRDLVPDPSRLQDMDRATARVGQAIRAGEKIAVFGDYDVDGATSVALLHRFFAAIGVPLGIYIPDRLKEGYGPNAPALARLAAEGVRLVITVDCGISAFEPLEAAAKSGLDVIVVDHHVAEPRLPRAAAVINPNRLDDTSELGQLAAVGVTYMLLIALNRHLRESGWYADRAEPDLLRWLDLVALGTVCDVVPLAGLNRALVVQGLKVMARRGNPGLAALADVAGVRERLGAYHLGFILGPRVNAGGRVGEAGLGARLLTTEDEVTARGLAEALDRYNLERRQIEQQVHDEAVAQVEAQVEAGADGAAPLVLAAGEGWHPGVVGIVASRLVRRYGRPACVVGWDGDAGKGSGRSIRGIDLGAAIIAARQAGLLANGGGHAMAAGFTVEAGRYDAFAAFLAERIAHQTEGLSLAPSLGFDGALTLGAATTEFLELVERAGPYGAGNPEPRFAFCDARIAKADVVGGAHVRAFLVEADGRRLKAIAFRAFESGLGEALLASSGKSLHIAGHLRADDWQGRQGVQLFIEDAAAV